MSSKILSPLYLDTVEITNWYYISLLIFHTPPLYLILTVEADTMVQYLNLYC